jgi:hypothetical protein
LTLKERLASSNGEEFFRSVKGTALPYLVGSVVSTSPAQNPDTLVLALSDARTPEVALHLRNGGFNGPLAAGTRIEFRGGEPTAFASDPFMLTIYISGTDIQVVPPKP